MNMGDDVQTGSDELALESGSSMEQEADARPTEASLSNEAVDADEEINQGLVEDSLSDVSRKSDPEIRRERRHRRAQLEEFLEEIGVESDDALELLYEVDRLVPDALAFSSGASLEKRFENASKNMELFRSPLYIKANPTIDFDALEDVDRRFKSNSTIEKMLKSEHGLLKAIMVNDRAQSAYAARLSEHEAAKTYLLKELVRRRSLAESWRYLIPKYLMPFLSAIQAAGISEKVFRPRRKFTGQFIDLLMAHASKKVARADIIAAMDQTEVQFAALLSADDDPFEGSSDQTTASDVDALAASDEVPDIAETPVSAGTADISAPKPGDMPDGALGDDLFEEDALPKAGAKAKGSTSKAKPAPVLEVRQIDNLQLH